jgi:ribonuclease HI
MTNAGKLPPPNTGRLFSDSDSPTTIPSGIHIANIDGASRGNPGPAAYAVLIRDPNGKTILELAKKMGRQTNNVAEYYALLTALDYATSHGISALRIRSDSELLVRQMQGRYKVKSPDLKPLFERASKLARQLRYVALEHVRRELNKEADALANLALDSGDFSSAPPVAPGPGRDDHPSPDPKPAQSRRLRARFRQGVFVPVEPIDLVEGTEVMLDIRPKGESA